MELDQVTFKLPTTGMFCTIFQQEKFGKQSLYKTFSVWLMRFTAMFT